MNARGVPTGRRVLITGATGFIGRQCLPLLVSRGHEVHAVSSRPHPPEAPGVHWHPLDLLTDHATDALCAQVRPEALLHLAWVTTPGLYTRTPANLDWVAASLRLVRSAVAHGARRLVAAGTCFEYAHEGVDRLPETAVLRPGTLYGASKVALGGLLAAFAREASVSSAWGRVFFLYGPHEHPDRLVASVVRALLSGEPAACTEGTQVRDFLHVRDVAAAFVALLDGEISGPVNIGSGEPLTVRALVREIGAQLGRPELIALGARPSSPRDPPRVVADVTRLRDEVGFQPGFGWREGLRDTIDWWSRSPIPSPGRASR